MNDVSVITGIGAGGAIAGWMARHFRNGIGGQSSEIIVLLRKIADNTANLPDTVSEGRKFMTESRLSMGMFERLETKIEQNSDRITQNSERIAQFTERK